MFRDGKGWVSNDQATYAKITLALRLVLRLMNDDRAVQCVCTMFSGTLHSEIDGGSPALTWRQIDADERAYDAADPSNVAEFHLTRRPGAPLPAIRMRKQSRAILDELR